ncbi:hypothetical protein [Holophaga foetida]|uniref:hypothetical protein n=1 Tax=Holophaga foetida TaxID=35839 RepID=UPI00024721A7|nr:hypothetical protein [Holophaga foetida]
MVVYGGTGYLAEGALAVFEALCREMKSRGIEQAIQLDLCPARGLDPVASEKGLVVSVESNGIYYPDVRLDMIKLVLNHQWAFTQG